MKKWISKNGGSLLFTCIIIGVFLPLYFVEPINPRKLNGVDSVYVDDSIYVIKFQIDTVIPDSKSIDEKKLSYDPF